MRPRLPALISLALCLVATPALAREEPVELRTPSGSLHGTLSIPDGPTPPPVALLIAGSGPTDRDGNGPTVGTRNDSLRLLARALRERGIASLRYDKRGIGASAAAGPAEADLRFDHYVDDAAAWVARLAADRRFARVAVVGHSEGALIGTIAVQATPEVALVSLAGASESADVLLRRQLAGKLPPPLAQASDRILDALAKGSTVADTPPELAALYRPSVQPYLVSWFRYVPTTEIAKVRAPCLVVQGDTDIQVAVADAQALGRAQPACTVRIVDGMNHVLKRVAADRSAQMASYGDPSLPVMPELIDAIAGFLAR